MWSLKRLALVPFLCLLGLTVLFGCRAFEPEVVIVNQPPDTFIMGAPAETSGGYFHFRIFWYGTDQDGRVEKFVWALTDTSVQDYRQDGDEEDQRFNPATNIGTLAIGNWTTRTDTVFDFQINQGASLAYEKTLHVVAVDDRGDFDRTPARLRFITNALGNPELVFYRAFPPRPDARFANFDTIGYGQPFTLAWTGSTPNIRSYSPELLAQRDTVPPLDGLFGYKFRISDEPCDDSREDCWRPRLFNPLSGDSVSFFGLTTALSFANAVDGAFDVRQLRLSSGVHRLLVNTIDVAGVQVPITKQALNYVVNYDPQTRLLRGETDPFNPSDTRVYPYFRVFQIGGAVDEFPFLPGDRVPDRSYVVFKAIGWDDARDIRRGDIVPYEVAFQGDFSARGLYNGTNPFPFFTQSSLSHRTPDWERPPAAGGGAADTLGFLVGPFDYTFNMRAVDEHGRRDGTPAQIPFAGNFPPCVQCVEILAGSEVPGQGFDCDDPDCAAEAPTIYATMSATPDVPPEWKRANMQPQAPGSQRIYFNLQSGAVWLDRPAFTAGVDSTIMGNYFEYDVVMHGADHPLEPAVALSAPVFSPRDRVKAWAYEIVAERDPANAFRDGYGNDDFREPTTKYWLRNSPTLSEPVVIDDDGVWIVRVKFFVPFLLLTNGEETYRTYLQAVYGPVSGLNVFDLTTGQLGVTLGRFQARDANNCRDYPERSSYHYYTNVRVPVVHGMDCNLAYGPPGAEAGRLPLEFFAAASGTFQKTWDLKVVPMTGPIFPPIAP